MAKTIKTKSKLDGYYNTLGIYNTKTDEFIRFQWVPSEISYNPESNFAAIASPSRNNPFYHFTGSDDTISFELTWLAITEKRDDVIQQCRALEALTKNNGSQEGVTPVLLFWGNSLFEAGQNVEAYLVTAAPYTLSDFHRPMDMMPTYAKQQITLKRITDNNRTTAQIEAVVDPVPRGNYRDLTEAELPFLNYTPDKPSILADKEDPRLNTNKLDTKQNIEGIQLNSERSQQIGEPSYFKNDRFARRRFLSERALELAKSAANNILNATVFGVTQKASSTITEIGALPNDKALSNIIPIPDYLK